MPTIVGILTFMCRKNFSLNWVAHEKSFITSGPDAASAETIKSEIFTTDNIIGIKEAVRCKSSHPNLLLNKAYQRHLEETGHMWSKKQKQRRMCSITTIRARTKYLCSDCCYRVRVVLLRQAKICKVLPQGVEVWLMLCNNLQLN